MGIPIGSGINTLGLSGITVKASTYYSQSSTATDTVGLELRPPVYVGKEVQRIGLYGCNFDTIGSIYFGDETNKITASFLEFADNTFASSKPLFKNFYGTSDVILRNKILSISASYSDGLPFALKLIDTGSIDGDSWNVFNSYGFTSTGSSS
jgi:hypothetical protein